MESLQLFTDKRFLTLMLIVCDARFRSSKCSSTPQAYELYVILSVTNTTKRIIISPKNGNGPSVKENKINRITKKKKKQSISKQLAENEEENRIQTRLMDTCFDMEQKVYYCNTTLSNILFRIILSFVYQVPTKAILPLD